MINNIIKYTQVILYIFFGMCSIMCLTNTIKSMMIPLSNNRYQECFQAAQDGDYITVVSIISKYPELITHTNGAQMSLLHIAACYDRYKIAQFLLDRKSPVNHQDTQGCTPLHHAVIHCNMEIIHLLLQHNASLNIRDRCLCSPIDYAGNKSKVLCLLNQYRYTSNINLN